jgi:hypothetical protein
MSVARPWNSFSLLRARRFCRPSSIRSSRHYPEKITADQALHFAESLARGEPNRGKIALTAISDKVREMI